MALPAPNLTRRNIGVAALAAAGRFCCTIRVPAEPEKAGFCVRAMRGIPVVVGELHGPGQMSRFGVIFRNCYQ